MIGGELCSMGSAVRVWSRPGLGKDWLECAGWDRMAKRCPCEHAWVHGCVCVRSCVCACSYTCTCAGARACMCVLRLATLRSSSRAQRLRRFRPGASGWEGFPRQGQRADAHESWSPGGLFSKNRFRVCKKVVSSFRHQFGGRLTSPSINRYHKNGRLFSK